MLYASIFSSCKLLELVAMNKVEQRRKEALSRTGDDGESILESSLQDVVSRYSFMDLWPCSSKDLDHLARQEVSNACYSF